jgi:hypothetical protein
VADAINALESADWPVRLVDCFAYFIARRETVDKSQWVWERVTAATVISLLPLFVVSLLRINGWGSRYPVIAWLGVYAAFSAYLIVVSDFVWKRLKDLAPRIDDLLGAPDFREQRRRRREVAKWVSRGSRLPLFLCLAGAIVSAVAVGLVDHRYSRVNTTQSRVILHVEPSRQVVIGAGGPTPAPLDVQISPEAQSTITRRASARSPAVSLQISTGERVAINGRTRASGPLELRILSGISSQQRRPVILHISAGWYFVNALTLFLAAQAVW